jgi:hypothetical protein
MVFDRAWCEARAREDFALAQRSLWLVSELEGRAGAECHSVNVAAPVLVRLQRLLLDCWEEQEDGVWLTPIWYVETVDPGVFPGVEQLFMAGTSYSTGGAMLKEMAAVALFPDPALVTVGGDS